jgi:hypothetical protein
MRRFELKTYNHQFKNRGVLQRVRRKIVQATRQGECILVDGEGIEGLSSEQFRDLLGGLDPEKVRIAGFPAHLLTDRGEDHGRAK